MLAVEMGMREHGVVWKWWKSLSGETGREAGCAKEGRESGVGMAREGEKKCRGNYEGMWQGYRREGGSKEVEGE